MAQSGRDISQRITLVGGVEVERTFVRIGQAAEKATADIDKGTTAATPGLKSMSAAGDAATQAFGDLSGALGEAATPIAALTSAFGGLTRGILAIPAAIVGATTALAGLAAFGAKVASDIKEAAIRTGATADQFTELSFAFRQSGSGSEGFEKAIGLIQTAQEAGGEAAKKFEDLGVALKDGSDKARPAVDVLLDVADQINAIDDASERSAKVVGLFGRRAGAELVESLSLGSAGLNELRAEAKALGLTFKEADLEIGKGFSDTLGKLGDAAKASTAKIGLAFAPLFGAVGESLAKAIGNAQPAMVAAAQGLADSLEPIFADLASAIAGDFDNIQNQSIRGLVEGIALIGTAVGTVGGIVGTSLNEIGLAFKTVADDINAVFGTKLTALDIPLFILGIKGVVFALGLLPPVLIAAGGAFNVLRAAVISTTAALTVGGIAGAFSTVTAAVATGIGAVTTAVADLAVAAAPFLLIGAAIAVVAAAILALTLPLETVKAAIADVFGEGVNQAIEDFATFLGDTLVGAFSLIESGLNTLVDWFSGAWAAIKSGFGALVSWIGDKIDTVLGWFRDLVQAARDVANAIASAFGASGGGEVTSGADGRARGGLVKAASGGLLRGPGSGSSDSIPAWLSDGEYVVNARSTAAFLPLLRAINGMRGFALGGLVEGLRDFAVPRTRFADGGLALAAAGSGGRPVTIVLPGGGSFALRGDANVVGALERAARFRAMTSGGPKPSWDRG